MAVGDTIFACRDAKHPTSAIAGVTHCRITPTTVSRKDQGAAGSTGRAGTLVTNHGITVEVFGTDFAALIALLGATAANLIIGTEGAAGTNEKLTIKNVYFVESIAAIEIPAKDEGGKLAPFGVRGIGFWGATDTFALMLTAAADV